MNMSPVLPSITLRNLNR